MELDTKMINHPDVILEIAVLVENYSGLFGYKFGEYPNEPIGNGNPYYRCSHCHVSDPQINMSNDNHSKSCEWVRAQYKLEQLKSQLNNYEKEKLKQIIDAL